MSPDSDGVREMDAQETQQGPSRGVRTTIETPSWELSAVDELLHHTVGMLFERETEVFDEGAASQRPIRAFFWGGTSHFFTYTG